MLQEIANMTGGKYYRADNSQRFQAIYAEIDKLEKTEAEVKKFAHHDELFAWVISPGLGAAAAGSSLAPHDLEEAAMNFANPHMLWLLLAIPPALLAFFWWAGRTRQRLLTQFIQARLLPTLTVGISATRQKIRVGCLVAGRGLPHPGAGAAAMGL